VKFETDEILKIIAVQIGCCHEIRGISRGIVRYRKSEVLRPRMLVPPVVAPVPRLLEYCEAKRENARPQRMSQAGYPRREAKIRRPWRTSESISEKLAAAPGMVARKVDAPLRKRRLAESARRHHLTRG